MDPRCLPARLTSLNAEDLVYYCGRHPERCPQHARLDAEAAARSATEGPPGPGRPPAAEERGRAGDR
jgi:hypothetical protein